ncbi:hypothetical protein N7541_007927 [Penicillium brevicompactum]|uniref:Uncharacterized protein n=2 Tax=Penicillium TaxID=5073 RepID=A0A9W9UNZ6_PENBR|nr:hypothetical protein HAV15_008877 [Penicillium sp. str. \
MTPNFPSFFLYGPPASLTVALFSGHLRIAIVKLAGGITLNQFEVPLIYKTTTKQPASNHCQYVRLVCSQWQWAGH